MIDLDIAVRAAESVASIGGSLWAADRGLPWLRAAAASASQGRGAKELLHLHRTAPVAARRLRESARSTADPAWWGVQPFRLIEGYVDGKVVQALPDRSMVVLGPPGGGKSSLLSSNVMAWALSVGRRRDGVSVNGLTICSSEAPDVLDACKNACLSAGPVYVFDPAGSTRGRPRERVTPLHWSPMRGAKKSAVALRRGKDLMAKAGEGTEGGSGHFAPACGLLLASLIHAGALVGEPWSTVNRWAVNFVSRTDKERPENAVVGGGAQALAILRSHPGADPVMRDHLTGFCSMDLKTLSPILSTLTPQLAWSANPDYCAAADAATDNEVDFRDLLSWPGSIFVVCPAGTAADDVSPLVVGFLGEVWSTLRELASETDDQRVPIPTLLALDEVPNTPVTDLPIWLATGRKYGVTTIAIGQDLVQFERSWDRQFASEILTTAGVKMLLPGIASSELTKWASEMTGDHIVERASKSMNWMRDLQIDANVHGLSDGDNPEPKTNKGFGWGRWRKNIRTEATTQTREPIMTPAQITSLKTGTAWVLDGNRPAGIVRLPSHWQMKPYSIWTAMPMPAERVEDVDITEPEPVEMPDADGWEDAPAAAGDGVILQLPRASQAS